MSDKHEYDGIIEHDHPLPRWWVFLFYATIVFGVGYYTYYEWLGGPTLDQELTQKLETIKGSQAAESENSNIDLAARMNDQEFIKMGAKVFAEKCFMCHGDKGQGVIGPNLTDKFWIHGGKPENVLAIVQKGVLDKGMPAWEAVLSTEEQAAVTVFIHSLKNTNPPNPKSPQGEEVAD